MAAVQRCLRCPETKAGDEKETDEKGEEKKFLLNDTCEKKDTFSHKRKGEGEDFCSFLPQKASLEAVQSGFVAPERLIGLFNTGMTNRSSI